MGELIRVLLVEDDEQDAELVRLELERGGFELTWRRVATEEKLRRTLREDRWDIIISDFAMPGFDGLHAFQVVQQLHIDVPFIFVSGALGEERAVEAMRTGARDYLLKENLTRLAVAVRRELATFRTKQSERMLEAGARQEQRRLGMAVEASGAGIFEYRIDGDAAPYLSARLLEILGHDDVDEPTAREMMNGVAALVHPDDLPTTNNAYKRFVEGRAIRFSAELRVKHKSGDWVEIAVFAKAVSRDKARKARHVIGVVMDLTERRALELQLRQAQKMEAIGLLAGGVAHDFNNLLTAIFSFARFAMDSMEAESEPYKDIEEVINAAERAQALTSQLLTFSRRQAVAPRIINVNELIQNIQRILTRIVGEDVRVVTQLADELGNVHIDPGSLEQVIMNLAVNARDALPKGGHFILRTSDTFIHEDSIMSEGVRVPSGHYVEICASDDGVGMDDATLRRVFEPFFTTKGIGLGTGLGLSTCYGIIKQADGYILVESAAQQGATFRILLPKTLDRVDGEPAPKEAKSSGGTETILIAEDEGQLRRLIARALSGLGYEVIEAANGKEALARFQEHSGPIQLLLTDVVMPEIGGKELAERLVAQDPELKVGFMSGYAPDMVADHGILEPATHLLHKPFTPEKLGSFVRNVLDAK